MATATAYDLEEPAQDAGFGERIRVNGCSIYFERRGFGAPLYVIHGGPGLDHTTVRAGFDRLEESHEVFYIDLRGHGQSDRCDPAQYTFRQLVDDLEELRRKLGHDRIALAGHSMGAKVALLYALRHPNRLSHLVLVGTNASPPRYVQRFLGAPGRLTARAGLLLWGMASAIRQVIGRPASLEATWSSFWSWCWPLYTRRRAPASSLQPILVSALKPPLCSVPALSMEIATLDLTRVLEQVRVRTLIVCGVEDVLFWADQSTVRRIPDSVFLPIPDAGHFPHIDQPERFAQGVGWFLMPSNSPLGSPSRRW